MVGSFVAFVPAIIAIVLAIITKQVYISLFAGIFVGTMCLSGGNPLTAMQDLFVTMAKQLGNNGGILIFLVVLGIFAVLMVKSGGSNAYSTWACTKIKSKRGALLMGQGLGLCFAIDDYFDCLTLGSVMRPITDKNKISHSKLSYLIHSSAAPFCIIAPISSWSASIATYLDGGIVSFFKTIPLNMYAICAIGMMLGTSILGFDLFKMRKDERISQKTGDLDAGETDLPVDSIKAEPNKNGKVIHLLFPIVALFICCIGCMLYNGYTTMKDAGATSFAFFDLFANCDSSIALATGSALALIITIAFYMITKVVSFKAAMDSIVQGFESMVPAMLILVFAWTLSAIMGAKGDGFSHICQTCGETCAYDILECTHCHGTSFGESFLTIDGSLNAKAFVLKTISADSMLIGIIPFVFFVIAALIAFATGTSWGTFGVLIPIAAAVVSPEYDGLYFLSMSAILAGAVFGDNTSPISDTTIMASSAAHSNHINHVKTQLPYSMIAAACAAVTYLVSGLIAGASSDGLGYGETVATTVLIGIPLFLVVLLCLYISHKRHFLGRKADAAADKMIEEGKYNKVEEETSEEVEKEEMVEA